MMGSLNKTAASATLHCLTGCAIGEVLGMVATSALNMKAAPSILVSIILAFVFGYSLSMRPLIKHGLSLKRALNVALLADTASIFVMELVDNGVILAVPGAVHAGLATWLFWSSLLASLAAAFVCAFPLNRFLIARGKGHALAHAFHHASASPGKRYRSHDNY
jgi:hypothetical protein